MNLDGLLQAIDRFFLDLIGLFVPGAILLWGCWTLLDQPPLPARTALLPSSVVVDLLVLISIGYALGYAVISIGETAVLPLVEMAAGLLRRSRFTAWLVPTAIVPEEQLLSEIRGSAEFDALIEQASPILPSRLSDDDSTSDVPLWRDMALSFAPEHRYSTYRFMFVSLLNLGVATALSAIVIFWLSLGAGRRLGIVYTGVPVNLWVVGTLVALSLLFVERRYQFYRRAMRVPFPVALVELSRQQDATTSDDPPNTEATSELLGERAQEPPVMFLSGGFYTGWQDRVTGACSSITFLDPRSHDLERSDLYAAWDLEAIGRSDHVFAYLEATNPGGYALALEVGYARSLGKRIILVDEKSKAGEEPERYLKMVRASADVVLGTFEEGLTYVVELDRMVRQSTFRDTMERGSPKREAE